MPAPQRHGDAPRSAILPRNFYGPYGKEFAAGEITGDDTPFGLGDGPGFGDALGLTVGKVLDTPTCSPRIVSIISKQFPTMEPGGPMTESGQNRPIPTGAYDTEPREKPLI